MKGGKPNEPENKAALRLAEFNAARAIPKTEKTATLKNKTSRKTLPPKTAKKKK